MTRLRLSPGQRHMMLATLLFSIMGALVKHLGHIPAHEIVSFRAAISLAVCWVALRRRGVSPWGNHRPLLLLRGAAGTVALLLFFHTLQRMPLASAATIQYLSPLFTVFFAGYLLQEPASPRQWLGFALCFAGVGMIKGFDSRVAGFDLALGIGAAGSSALAYTVVRRLRATDDPLVVVFYFPLVTLPVIGPYTAYHWVSPQGLDWLWLLGVGLLTQAAQVHLTRAYHLEKAANIVHLTYMGSLYALGFGYLLFAEAIPLAALAGILLVIAGVVLASRFSRTAALG